MCWLNVFDLASDSTLTNYNFENKKRTGPQSEHFRFNVVCSKLQTLAPYLCSAGSATHGAGAQVASSLAGEGGQDGADRISQRQG